MPRFQFTIPLIVEQLNPDGSIAGNPTRHELEVTGEAESMKEAIDGFEAQFSFALARVAAEPMQSKAIMADYNELTGEYLKGIKAILGGMKDKNDPDKRTLLREVGDLLAIAKNL